MDAAEEQKIIERAKTDPQAFGLIFDSYYSKIANYVFRRVGEIEAAEDITSIVFFKVWGSLPAFEWRGLPFSAWIYRIANNETNTYFRQKKHHLVSLDALFEETGFELPSEHTVETKLRQLEEVQAIHQDFQLIQKLLLELPLKYQEVLALRYFEKKSIKDIADITGKKTNTIKSLTARGTNKLKKAFAVHKRHEETI